MPGIPRRGPGRARLLTGRTVASLIVAVATSLLLVVEPLPAVARVFGGVIDDVLTQPPLAPTPPETDSLRGLEYGNPAEGISLATVPQPDHLGEAQAAYPIDIPPGRLDWQPDLSLQYGSRIPNGWLGVGWDLFVPSITVDTRWGVPRYRDDRESETYLFEGEQLHPTAHTRDQPRREAEKVFTKRVEGSYSLIRRHGDRPSNYWWEVHDKLGNKYFYGRTPETDVGVPEAILRGDGDAAYWWGLVEQRDISNNTVTYFYDRVEDTGVGDGDQGGAPKGAQLYISRINYSGSVDFDDDDDGELPRFGPYDVVFTRDKQIEPYTRRPDVMIDARAGALRVTSHLLRNVKVTYTEAGTTHQVRSYDLSYEKGPFEKSLLRTIGQADADGHVFATHRFEYFNDVQSNGQYDGFAHETTPYDTGDDVGGELGSVRPTALGASKTSSGDGRVYLGFNPIGPDKGLSIGGGLAMDGSDGESEIELIDINGDNLPDKVWKSGGIVRYRLNQTRPGEQPSFGPDTELRSLPGMPEESSFGVSVGPEAYFLVGDIMFHHGWQFDTASSYFSDVNADGLVDFVDGGTVWFNHLENGAPVFEPHSGNTAVPISDEGISPDIRPDDGHLEAQARKSFPLQDTLRRWVAPWNGTVTVEGPIAVKGDSVDGVRVAIQHNGIELWREAIPRGSTAPVAPSVQVAVQKGDRIYFRLQSVDDGAGDSVEWDPIVTYANDLEAPRLDVNGKDVNRYVASQDFTLGGRSGIVTGMPLTGRVRLEGKVRKLRATSDDVSVVAELNGIAIASPQVIPAAAAGDFPVVLEFDVREPRTSPDPCKPDSPCVDQLSLRLAADSPIDATAVVWTDQAGTSGPLLYYATASRGGRPVTTHDGDGRPIVQLRPPYDIDVYPENTLGGPQASWTPNDGDDVPGETYEVTVEAKAFGAGIDPSLLPATPVFTVKNRNGLVKKQPLPLAAPPPSPNPLPNQPPPLVERSEDVTFVATEGVEYWFDFTVREPRLGMVLRTEVDGGRPSARHWPRLVLFDDAADAFPQPYRGWGFAGYNGDGDRAGAPVPEPSLILRSSDFPRNESEKPDGFDDDDYKDPIKGKAYPYTPKPAFNRWEGPKSTAPTDDTNPEPRPNIAGGTWGSAGGASASRVGPDSVGTPTGGAGTGRAPELEGRAEQNSFGAGLSVGLGAGAGVSWGYSRGTVDFVDLNGDGYPDVVGHRAGAPGEVRRTAIQYTTEVGGLDPQLGELGASDVRTDRQYSSTLQGSGATPKIKGSANGEGGSSGGGEGDGGGDDPDGDDASGSSAGVNLGFSGGLGHGEVNKTTGLNEALPWTPGMDVETDLADLNGDGLPDRVRVDGDDLHVAWNLGYRFTHETVFPGGALEEAQSDNASVGITAGFNAGRFDFSGGVSLQRDEEHTDITWIDLNGDGLVDRLQSRTSGPAFPDELLEGFKVERDGVEVRFNTGAGLGPPTSFGRFQDDEIARSESFGVGGGADFTIGIGPLCWVVKLCYIIINPGGHGERTVSAQRLAIVDVNGDGYPDSVTSSDDDRLNVAENRTGRTNLLKSIDRPLGARITIDYERDGNTIDQPFSLWVLKAVSVSDGHEGDGVDTTVTRWDYSDDNVYDYAERELYGYRTIAERHVDENGSVYRSTERTYLNGNYYERGLLATETLVDGAGTPFTSTVNTYRPVDSRNGQPANLGDLTGTVFPGLVKVEQRWHEGSGAVAKQTETRTTFDLRGNPVKVVDTGEPGGADDVVAETTYTRCDAHESFPWTQVPQALRILDGTGKVMRHRVGDTPCDYAAIVALDEHLSAGGNGDRAHIDVGYVDPGGQVGSVTGPENHRGDVDEVTYTFDPLTGYLTSVTDGHGLVTTATWDNVFGRLASTTDPNGGTTSYTYDRRGRLETVTGPLQQGGAPTVTFTYHAEDADPWVEATSFDPANPGEPITTVRMIDGVEKEIQRKHDAAVFTPGRPAQDVMVVSGSTYFDAFWRPVRQFYPITEQRGTAGVFNAADDSSALPTVTTYDVRDRIVNVVAPGPRETATAYGFDRGPFGSVLHTEDVVDPEGKRVRKYVDARGDTVGVDRSYRDGTTDRSFLTRFAYDPLQQLVRTTDPGGAVTSITYDLLGRQTVVDAPDSGKVELGYDLMSNVISRVTPELRKDRQAVTYDYDIRRLIEIDYADDRSNDVTYTWGGTDDATKRVNGVGRIITVVDGSRTQDRKYDKLGNVVETRDVMKVHNLNSDTAPAHTFTTRFVRDHWGRILNLTYPDGEVVTTSYDSGGLPRAVSGVKGPFTYRYVDRLEYDKFGSRRHLAYGNGVATTTGYDPDTLWLANQVVTRGTTELQDLRYSYDKVGNPEERLDDIPVPPASEKGGPSRQTFGYDDLYRLTSAEGTYSFAPDKRRDYTLGVAYDAAGRMTTKNQTDTIVEPSGRTTPQSDTTYRLAYRYEADQPHAPSRVGSRTFSWDDNGNNTGWREDRGGTRRTITWDEENRAASIADQGNRTQYRYGHDHVLSLERGPLGEVEYVNEWYTALNGGVAWKDVFAGDLRVATKRMFSDGSEEHQRYFLTGDLIGSITLVTDAGGGLFEHLEYLPGGEIWVREHSEVYRQPHLYAGMYHDEARFLYRTDARWYEPREALLLSPDPLLVDKPVAAVTEPRLLADYAYAFDNPTRFVDSTGTSATDALLKFTEGKILVPFKADHQKKVRTDFKAKNPKAAKNLRNVTKPLKKAAAFIDDIQTISFDVTVGPKGIKIKKIKVFKFKVFSVKKTSSGAKAR